jgi:hypothetical protein
VKLEVWDSNPSPCRNESEACPLNEAPRSAILSSCFKSSLCPRCIFRKREGRGANTSFSLKSSSRPGWPDWANFRPMGDCLLFRYFENYRSSPYFWLLFPRLRLYINFDKKMNWASFWAIFSQINPVTLLTSADSEVSQNIFLLLPKWPIKNL